MQYNFPPIGWLWEDYRRNAAWYSGDPQRLRSTSDRTCGRFWQSDEIVKVHVPIAADIASLSAASIFSESPVITCEDERTQERIDEILEESGMYSVLLQGAELASVFGGVFVKLSWDAVADVCPRLAAVPADAGMVEWRGGKQYSITLWSVIREENGAVWRLVEEYGADGHIRTRLHKGDAENLGKEIALTALDETKNIKPDVNSGTGMLLAQYVPNMLPNRRAPHVRFGRSDFDGLYGLFDELDEVYSSIQRETRLTKTTVVVPMEYLRRKDDIRHQFDSEAKKAEWVFDNGKGVFVGLDIDTGENASPVTVINPEIRAEQRIALCDDLVKRILSMAGYAPQSAGIDVNGRAESGTALAVRERKTLRTTETKKTHWWHALQHIVRAMLKLDAAVYKSGVDPNAGITVELPSNSQPDIDQMAQILEQLERAGAISVEGKVRLLHPDWGDDKILEEVRMIREERGLTGPDPLDQTLGDFETPKEQDDAE